MQRICRSLWIASVLVITLGGAAISRAVDFAPQKTYPVGTSPSAIVVGDFNGDGKPDLAVLNSESRSVSILLGNGQGGFQPARNFDVGGDNPTSVSVADFNGDGKLDLAIAIPGDIPASPTTFSSCTQSSVNLMLGNGDGTFQAARRVVTVDSSNLSLTVGDLNGDAKTDLVVLRSQRDPACPVGGGTIFLGSGDGSFQTAGEIAAAAPVLVADFNGDGKADLLAGASILLGNGDGTFQPPLAFSLPSSCGLFCFVIYPSFVTGDFNGDGKPDLAIAQGTKHCVDSCGAFPYNFSTLIMLGNGDGTFQKATSVGSGGSFLLSGDFNGDGKLDVIGAPTVFSGSSLFYLLLGKGDGTFPTQFTFDIGSGPSYLLAADLNSDKLPDIVSANLTENSVGVMLNTSSTPGADLSVQVSATPEPVSVTQNLTYTVRAINSGPQDATSIVLKNTLPAGVNFVSATTNQGSCTQADLVVTCNINKLVSGDSLTASIVVIPTATGSVDDTASASATETDAFLGNNNASHTTHVDPMFSLKVTKSGAGSGIVRSNLGTIPNPINCGSTCAANEPTGTSVNLVVEPDAGSVFGGWGGACGPPPNIAPGCDLTMNQDQAAAAIFDVGPNFLLAADATSLSVSRGGSVSTTASIYPEGNSFDTAIALTCAIDGPSPKPSCTLSPATLTPGPDHVVSTLTITAAALSTSLTAPWFDQGGRLYATGVPFGVLGFVLATRFDKKRRRMWALCLLIMATAILPAACGSGSNVTKDPPPQNYRVTVTATSGTIHHSTQVSVTVN